VRPAPVDVGPFPWARREHGDQVERMVDAEVRRLLETALSRSQDILLERRPLLQRAAGQLLAREVLEGEDLQAMEAAGKEAGAPAAMPH